MTLTKILVVDDDPQIRKLLRRGLEGDGFTVREAAAERDTMSAIAGEAIDLVTLDLNLGAESGLGIAKAIRVVCDVPIIMVTGKGDVIDRVVGLELGADDYIAKPFHMREVIARIRAVLRRREKGSESIDAVELIESKDKSIETPFRFDGLVARPDRFELIDRAGASVELTSGDFRLLQIFLERPKRVLSREQIMDWLNGTEWAPLDRTIDNQVARLRKKIERDPANPRLIKTVRGIGYTLATEVERA